MLFDELVGYRLSNWEKQFNTKVHTTIASIGRVCNIHWRIDRIETPDLFHFPKIPLASDPDLFFLSSSEIPVKLIAVYLGVWLHVVAYHPDILTSFLVSAFGYFSKGQVFHASLCSRSLIHSYKLIYFVQLTVSWDLIKWYVWFDLTVSVIDFISTMGLRRSRLMLVTRLSCWNCVSDVMPNAVECSNSTKHLARSSHPIRIIR